MAGLQSHSLPVKTEGHFWVCLLGLWMEKLLSEAAGESRLCALWRDKRSCLEGQALQFPRRERELPQPSVLPAQNLCVQ